jgi:hypothetical protein
MKFISRSAFACTFLLTLSSVASAQATRTWVSGVGDDVNPCSRTAPCKTLAGAISKTAVDGIISILDPGGYGSLNVVKSITIDGGAVEGSVLAGGAGTYGFLINTAGVELTIRNMNILGSQGSTYGIRITSAAAGAKVTVEDVFIENFVHGIHVDANAQLNVRNTVITKNSQYGAYVRGAKASFDNVRFEHNTIDGLRAGNGATVTVRKSLVTGSGNLGFSATEAATTKLMIEDCTVTNNAWGIGAADGAGIWVSATTIAHQSTQGLWNNAGSTLVSFGNNRLANNVTPGSFTSTIALQ